MKRFIFRLEALLRYREHLEHLAQQEAAKAYSKVLACEKRIADFIEDLRRTAHELDERMIEGINAQQYQLYSSYLTGLESSLERERNHHKDRLNILVQKQKILSQKSVEKKVLENLKERQKTEYYTEMTKNLQKETEEMNIIRKIRNIEE